MYGRSQVCVRSTLHPLHPNVYIFLCEKLKKNAIFIFISMYMLPFLRKIGH
jgi:hypothetical protein